MAKSDVIYDATSRYKPREVNQGGTSTVAGVPFTTDGTELVVLNFPTAGGSGGTSMSRRRSKTLTARAWGRCTGGGVTNFAAWIVYGTVSDVTAISLSFTTPRAIDNESENWYTEVLLIWDSTSNKLNGQWRSQVGALIDPWTVNPFEVVADLDGNQNLGMFVTTQFTAGFTGNLAYLDGFQLEEC